MHNLRTERSWRNVRYASRLPRDMAGQNYLSAILLPIFVLKKEKCDCNHIHIVKIKCHIKKAYILSYSEYSAHPLSCQKVRAYLL